MPGVSNEAIVIPAGEGVLSPSGHSAANGSSRGRSGAALCGAPGTRSRAELPGAALAVELMDEMQQASTRPSG